MEYSLVNKQNTVTVQIKGKFTFSDHHCFKEIMEKTTHSECKEVIIDCSKIDFVDSAALGMFLIFKDFCEDGGMSLIIQSPAGQVEKMFHVSKFDSLFTIR
jgi:anti-anti-sigma factor